MYFHADYVSNFTSDRKDGDVSQSPDLVYLNKASLDTENLLQAIPFGLVFSVQFLCFNKEDKSKISFIKEGHR